MKRFVLFTFLISFLLTSCSLNLTDFTGKTSTAVQSLELNAPYTIDTSSGSYTLTLLGLYQTDWWERYKDNSEKQVVVLHFVLENQNFKNLLSKGADLNPQGFVLFDENNNPLSQFTTLYDIFNEPELVLPGTKREFGIGYIVEEPSESYSLTFKRTNEEQFTANLSLVPNPFQPSEEIDLSKATMPGEYTVGKDMEPGLYMVFKEDDTYSGYFSVSSESDKEKILYSDNLRTHSIIDVKKGEYLTLSRSYAVPYDGAPELKPVYGKFYDGMYGIGKHLAAGEYEIAATDDTGFFCIYNDARQTTIVDIETFSGSRTITVQDGEFLKLSRCQLIYEK